MTLQLWKRPDNYGGADWPNHYVFLGQHRDSDSVGRSNFISGLKAIGGETDTVLVVREGHWAVGWVEWIAIHKSDAKALKTANEIADALEDYPVVNETHLSELDWEEACDYWERMSVRERAEYCDRAGISIFAARRDYFPENDGTLLELLRD
jgi:hypothetical protein